MVMNICGAHRLVIPPEKNKPLHKYIIAFLLKLYYATKKYL